MNGIEYQYLVIHSFAICCLIYFLCRQAVYLSEMRSISQEGSGLLSPFLREENMGQMPVYLYNTYLDERKLKRNPNLTSKSVSKQFLNIAIVRLIFTGCSINIVCFFLSKNSRNIATSPSSALGCYWLYKKLPAIRSDCTLALR